MYCLSKEYDRKGKGDGLHKCLDSDFPTPETHLRHRVIDALESIKGEKRAGRHELGKRQHPVAGGHIEDSLRCKLGLLVNHFTSLRTESVW